jgi:hypothetical protein
MNYNTNTTTDGLSDRSSGLKPEMLDENKFAISSAQKLTEFFKDFVLWDQMLGELYDDPLDYFKDDFDGELFKFFSNLTVQLTPADFDNLGFPNLAEAAKLYPRFAMGPSAQNKRKKILPTVSFALSNSRQEKSPKKYKKRRQQKRDVKFSKLDLEPQGLNPFSPAMDVISGISRTAGDLSEIVTILKPFGTPELATQVKTCIRNFSSLSEDIKEKVTPESLVKLVEAPSKISEAFKTLASVFDGTKESLATTTLWISVGAGIHYLHSRDRSSMYISGIAGLFALTLNNGHSMILDWLCKSYKPSYDESLKPNFGVDDISTAASVGVAALAAVIGLSTPKVNLSKLAFSYFEKKDRLGKSLTDSLRGVLLFFEYVFNKVRSYFGDYAYVKFFSSSLPEVDSFIDSVEVLRRQLEKHEVVFTQTSYDRVLALFRIGTKLIKELPPGNPTSGVSYLIRTRLSVLEKLLKEFQDSHFLGDGSRPEPVAILLRGIPGTGKSQMLDFLHNALTAATLPQELIDDFNEGPDKYLYYRAHEQVYWDGYNDHKWVTIFDDLGQVRDTVGTGDGEWMNFIRAKNVAPYNLHMAAIGDKAGTFFKSKFILCSSNQDKLTSGAIWDMEAVNRRFDFDISVEFKDEYLLGDKKTFDTSKLPGGKFTPDVPLLRLCNRNAKTSRLITFDELVRLSVDKYHSYRARYEDRNMVHSGIRDVYGNLDLTFDPYDGNEQLAMEDLNDYIVADSDSDDDFNSDLHHRQGHTLDQQFGTHSKGLLSIFSMDTTHLRYMLNYFATEPQALEFIKLFEIKYALRGYPSQTRLFELVNIIEGEYGFELNLKYDLVAHALYSFYRHFGDDAMSLFFDGNEIAWHEALELYELAPKILLGPRLNISSVKLHYVKIKDKIALYLADPKISIFSRIYRWIRDSYAVLSGLGIVLAVGGYLYSLYTGKPSPVSEDQSFGHSDKMHEAPSTRMKNLKAKLAAKHPGILKSQMAGGTPHVGYDLADKISKKNIWDFRPQNRHGSFLSSGYGVFVRDRYLLVPAHYLTTLGAGCAEDRLALNWKLKLINHDSNEEYQMTLQELLFAPTIMKDESDLALVNLDGLIKNQAQDIVARFVSQKELENYNNVPSMITCPGNPSLTRIGQARFLKQEGVNTPGTKAYYRVHQVMRYDGRFCKGDCGRPLFLLHNNAHYGVFAGIHVAGNDQFGIAAVMTREVLEDLISEFEEAPHLETQMLLSELPERFTFLKSISPPVLSSGKSNIRHSRLHSMWGPAITKPSHTKPFHNLEGNIVDPFSMALSKYCINNINTMVFDLEKVARIAVFYGDWLERVQYNRIEPKIFDFETAVCGLPGEKFFKSVKRASSPGYPLIHDRDVRRKKGSFAIFGEGQEYDLTTTLCKKLKNNVQGMLDLASQGIRSEVYYTDNLKVERVLLEKWLAGKTRLFSGCPEDYLLANRQMFGRFCQWYFSNHTTNGSAVGVNPYSYEWDVIAKNFKRMCGDHPNVGAGDYSGYDGREIPEIHDTILGIINRWYFRRMKDENHSVVRQTLWKDLTNSKHVHQDMIYIWPSSLPSGHPLTTPVNTIYNNINLRYAWLRMCEDLDLGLAFGEAMAEFVENVYLICLGDDNAFAVSDRYALHFNEQTISRYVLELGMVYTSETKGETSSSLRKLEEIEFLKRSFRYDTDLRRWVAPLRLSVVLEIPYWTRNVTNMQDAIVDSNVQESLYELSLHGKEVFNEWAPKIIDAYREQYDRVPLRQDFRACQEFVLDAELLWL